MALVGTTLRCPLSEWRNPATPFYSDRGGTAAAVGFRTRPIRKKAQFVGGVWASSVSPFGFTFGIVISNI